LIQTVGSGFFGNRVPGLHVQPRDAVVDEVIECGKFACVQQLVEQFPVSGLATNQE